MEPERVAVPAYPTIPTCKARVHPLASPYSGIRVNFRVFINNQVAFGNIHVNIVSVYFGVGHIDPTVCAKDLEDNPAVEEQGTSSNGGIHHIHVPGEVNQKLPARINVLVIDFTSR